MHAPRAAVEVSRNVLSSCMQWITSGGRQDGLCLLDVTPAASGGPRRTAGCFALTCSALKLSHAPGGDDDKRQIVALNSDRRNMSKGPVPDDFAGLMLTYTKLHSNFRHC